MRYEGTTARDQTSAALERVVQGLIGDALSKVLLVAKADGIH